MGWLLHALLNGGKVYVECYILKTGMEQIVHGHLIKSWGLIESQGGYRARGHPRGHSLP